MPSKETKQAPPSKPASPPTEAISVAAPSETLESTPLPANSSLLDYRNADSDSEDESSAKPEQNGKATNGKASLLLEDLNEMEDDPDSAYIATKMQITTLQRSLGLAVKGGGKKGAKAKAKPVTLATNEQKADMAHLQQLEMLLKRIQQMYLFDQKRADAAYAIERARVDKLDLADRLSGKAQERKQVAKPLEQPVGDVKPPTTAPDVLADISAGESLLEGMLDEPADTASESAEPERNAQGTVISVRDMALPKNFTGKTPRSLLEDTIRRLDKFGKSTYRVISRSRAYRAVVTIRWDGGKVQQFGMEDEACENQDQAFHYVSTMALFALAGDTSPQRLLPAKYRDLWDELAARSKEAETAAYRKQLELFKRLASGRQTSVPSTPALSPTLRPKQVNGSLAAVPTADVGTPKPPRELPEQLVSELAARQATQSYQAMLVSLLYSSNSYLLTDNLSASAPESANCSLSRHNSLDSRCQRSHGALRGDWMW